MAFKKRLLDWRLLILLPIPLLWALASQTGYLRFLDDLLIDYRFRWRKEIPAPIKIVYVDIDSKSIEELGNFPWFRSHFADVCRALTEEGKAKGVGIDIVFSEKGVSGAYDLEKWIPANRQFRAYLQQTPAVVVAASYSASEKVDDKGRRVPIPFPLLRDGLPDVSEIDPPELPEFNIGRGMVWNPPRIGLIDTLEGGTRWVALFAPSYIKRYEHMALQLALLYWGVSPDDIRITDTALEIPRPDGGLYASIPLVDGQLVELNWFSPWLSEHNPRTSFSIVFNYVHALKSGDPKAQANARTFFTQFKDAIVLIGPVDPLLQDLAVTPFDHSPAPKVGVHGNLLKTIVSGEYLHRLPVWGVYVLSLLLALPVTLLGMAGGARSLWAKVAANLIVALYSAFCFEAFRYWHLVLPMAAPLGGAMSMAFAGIAWQLIVEEKQKGRIKGMFSTYLAPTVVNSMIDSGREPELGGHKATITAYFSDIQSFSTFSELMPASQLVELMNEYLTACTDIIQEEGGTLDKYIGDAVVAFFGAPLDLRDHAYHACLSTIRVQTRINELRDKWQGEMTPEAKAKWPKVVHNLRARLGLNTGDAIIGNMGSRSRFSYTMMGDNVNLAARMESGAKSLGVYTMITESTKLECEKHGGDKIVFRFLDRIIVKGRSQPVPVYEVVGLRSELTQQVHDCLGLHARGIELYTRQDFDAAIAMFEQSSMLEPMQPGVRGIAGNPSLIMIERCHYWKQHPPAAGWNGVWEMKEK